MATNDSVPLLQGTLDMLILKSLISGARHGYDITQWIQSSSQDVLTIEDGSLYPALHRLERRGWIESEWGVSESNRRAKYYSLTSTGRSRFAVEVNAWESVVRGITLVLNAKPRKA
jgi:PadR family transcriptional regulator PadR